MNGIVSSRIVSWFLALAFMLSSLGGLGLVKEPDPTLEAPAWPPWVHEHWIWENERN